MVSSSVTLEDGKAANVSVPVPPTVGRVMDIRQGVENSS